MEGTEAGRYITTMDCEAGSAVFLGRTISPVEAAIRTAGANADAATAGKGALGVYLAGTSNPQETAATLSIVTRDWCKRARRAKVPRAELEALRAAARFARQIHLRLEDCARDRPLSVYRAVNGTRRGFTRPIPGLLPDGHTRRKLKPYRVAYTRAKWDKRMAFAPWTEDTRPWWGRSAA